MEYLPVLDLADVLFARKFDPALDHQVLDAIDDLRSLNKVPNAVPSSGTLAFQAANAEAQAAQSSSSTIVTSTTNEDSGSRSGDSVSVLATDDDECSDAHANCRDWAALGECDKNPAWMLEFCAYSCGSCQEAQEEELTAITVTVLSEIKSKDDSSPGESEAVEALRRAAKKPNFLGGMVLTVGDGAGPSANDTDHAANSSVDGFNDGHYSAKGWGGLLCVQMANRRGARATLQACAPDSTPLQTIDFGPCSQDGSLHFEESRHRVVTEKGTYAPPFCLAQVSLGSSPAGDEGQKVGVPAPTTGKACLDVEREQVKTGAKLINWPCQKTKWNQLFSFLVFEESPSSSPTSVQGGGSLYINIPFAHHRDKHMCVTVASVQVGAELELSPCRDDDHLQRLMFHRASVLTKAN